MKLIDARGLPCPKPVILTKEAIEESSGGEVIRVLVDNAAARDNILRLAKNSGADAEVATESDELFSIEIVLPQPNRSAKGRNGKKASKRCSEKNRERESHKSVAKLTVLITSDTLGRPEERLGALLIGSFLDTLSCIGQRPNAIVFMNAGVKLVCEDSQHIEKLKRLAEKGVELLVCGTCLDYFHLKDKVLVGTVSNMFTIAETLASSDRTICF